MDFDNGIFRTVPCEGVEGAVWVVRVSDGFKYGICRGYDDIMETVGELMRQRISQFQGFNPESPSLVGGIAVAGYSKKSPSDFGPK